VFVTNIAPTATAKTVADFFAFCGTITSLTMRTKRGSPEKVQEAVIEFKQEAATKTALLLSNALIVDRPITVSRFVSARQKALSEKDKEDQNQQTLEENEIENKDHKVPASQRTETSVVASLLAAGYTLANGSLEAAKKYDDLHKISSRLSETTGAIKAKAVEIDKDYKISETASSWTASTFNAISDIDKKYAISSSATAIVHSAGDAMKESVKPITTNSAYITTVGTFKTTGESIAAYADQAGKFLGEQPPIKSTTEFVKSTSAKVKGEYDAVVQETNRLIEEKKS